MKKTMVALAVLFVVFLTGSCMAQTQEIADTTLQNLWEEYPQARPMLKSQFPDLFKLVMLDSTLFGGWRIFGVDNNETYYAVHRVDGDWSAAVKIGSVQGEGFAKTFIGSDSLWIFGEGVRNTVPADTQELIDKLNE